MNEPLSWIWVAQVVVIIAAVAAGRRPTWHHAITHEVNKSWEEIKAEIEARERVKPQWVYLGPTTSARTALAPTVAHRVRPDRRHHSSRSVAAAVRSAR
jgi:hypothetical protein